MARSGFTLIELLVVVAIICILAAVLFPVFNSAMERGRQATCLSNMKQMGVGFRLYCDENNGRMPSAGTYLNGGSSERDWCGCQISAPVGNQVYPKTGVLFQYLKSAKLFLCPTDRKLPALHVNGITDYNLSYSMNWFLHHYPLDRVQNSKKVLLIIHESRKTINDGLFLWNQSTNDDMPDDVHYDGTNTLYCDLHAIWSPYKSLVRARTTGEWLCFPGQGNPPNNVR